MHESSVEPVSGAQVKSASRRPPSPGSLVAHAVARDGVAGGREHRSDRWPTPSPGTTGSPRPGLQRPRHRPHRAAARVLPRGLPPEAPRPLSPMRPRCPQRRASHPSRSTGVSPSGSRGASPAGTARRPRTSASSLHTDFAAVTRPGRGRGRRAHRAAQPPTAAVAEVVDRGGWVGANVALDAHAARPAQRPVRRAHGAQPGRAGRPTRRRHRARRSCSATSRSGCSASTTCSSPTTDGGAIADDAVYYVGPNVLGLEKRYAFRPRDFRLWIALHEVTHRAQFTGVPWLRDYFLELVGELVGGVEPDPEACCSARCAARSTRCARVATRSTRAAWSSLFAVDGAARDAGQGAGAHVAARRPRQRGDEPARRADLVDGQARMAHVLLGASQRARRRPRCCTGCIGLELKMQPVRGRRGVRRRHRARGRLPRARRGVAGPRAAADARRARRARRPGSPGSTASPSLTAVARRRTAVPTLATATALDLDGLVGPGGGRVLRWRRTRSRCSSSRPTPGSQPVAVHVDHGLRPDSAADADVVRDAAATLGVPCALASRVAVAPGANLEARARDARYAALRSRARASSARPRCSSPTPPTTRPRPCC